LTEVVSKIIYSRCKGKMLLENYHKTHLIKTKFTRAGLPSFITIDSESWKFR